MPQPRTANRPRRKRPNGAGWLQSTGYVYVWADHRATGLHRLVMREILGRPLLRSEHVHHLDGDRQNNRPEKLLLLSAAAHMLHHHRKRPFFLWCDQCGRPFLTAGRHICRKVPRFCSTQCTGAWRSRRVRAARLGLPAPRPARKRPIPEPA